MEVDLAAATLDARFSDFDLHGIGSDGKTIADIRFEDVGIRADGTFLTIGTSKEIEGSFYGPNHEEVGGTFNAAPGDDYTGRVVVGAFGAERGN